MRCSIALRIVGFAIALLLVRGLESAAQPPATAAEPSDPLPSWNEGAAKQAILDFVRRTTSKDSQDYVAPDDRIAVFDNDGTLWPEDPLPFALAFSFDTAKAMLAARPELAEKPAYKALEKHDVAALTENHLKLLMELVVATHAGQTTEQFDKAVADWIAKAKHPRFDRLYADCTYLPMQEVLKLLRASGYQTFIVSGGGQDFMRVWSQKIYGIPPQQVIGSVLRTKYELLNDKPTLTILPEIALIDDKAGKPTGIHAFIGKRPVMCFGNSDGDHQMLQYTTIGRQPSFGLLVHHTDAEREYAYDAHPKSSGKLVEALEAAPQRGWIVVDMKKDWKKVFSWE